MPGASRLDSDSFYQQSFSIPFLPIATNTTLSLDERVKKIENSILSLLNQHAPIKQVRVRGPCNPWLDDKVLRLINLKNKCYKSIFQSGITATGNQKLHFRKFHNYTLSQIKRAKTKYYSAEVSKDNPVILQVYSKILGKQSSTPTILSLVSKGNELADKQEIAEAMNSFLTDISICKSTLRSNPLQATPHSTTRSLWQ